MVRGFRWLAWARCVTLILTILAQPALVLGAPPTAATGAKSKKLTPEQKEAAQHSATAAAALKSGDAETAVRELKTARELAPSAPVLLDLSRALVLTGNPLEARDVLKALLATYGKDLGPTRPQFESELTRVQGKIASLKLELGEAGASVALDGKEVGTTPLAAPIESNPGAHTIAVTKPGFVAVTRQQNLTPGSTVLTLELVREKSTGKLVVVSATSDAMQLLLNDKPAGKVPFEGDLEPGTYKVSAEGPRAKAEPQTVRVELGQTTSVTLATGAIPGDVRVNAGDPAAEIFIDDRPIGKGEWQGSIAAGPHQLRVERPGYAPHRQTLEVTAAERVVVDQIAYVPLAASKADDTAEYQGIFANVSLLGFFGAGSSNEISQDCAANATGGNCSSTRPAGGGLGFRMGYSFGWIALEGLLIGGIDVARADAKYEYGTPEALGDYYGVPRDEHYVFMRWGYGLGVGARVITQDPFLRVTGGLDGTLLRRTQQYVRATTADSPIPDAQDTTSRPNSYFNPGLMADIGLMIGRTPGAKFHVGLALLVEFPPDPVTADANDARLGRYVTSKGEEAYGTPPLDMSRGPQVVAGPFLAMQFGH